MPLFINNESELMNENDNDSLPANTPSTGSLSFGHVEQCGNRVLELIEQHKKEIQTRMAKKESGFQRLIEDTNKKLLEQWEKEKQEKREAAKKLYMNSRNPDSTTFPSWSTLGPSPARTSIVLSEVDSERPEDGDEDYLELEHMTNSARSSCSEEWMETETETETSTRTSGMLSRVRNWIEKLLVMIVAVFTLAWRFCRENLYQLALATGFISVLILLAVYVRMFPTAHPKNNNKYFNGPIM